MKDVKELAIITLSLVLLVTSFSLGYLSQENAKLKAENEVCYDKSIR